MMNKSALFIQENKTTRDFAVQRAASATAESATAAALVDLEPAQTELEGLRAELCKTELIPMR